MNPRASVTVTLDEYQKLSTGLPVGAAVTVAVGAFLIGLVVGMTSVDEANEAPTPRPTTVVTQPVAVVRI